jgi:hypothetical protein
MRETHRPQTTFYPSRYLPTAHLSLHALGAPRAHRGGQPLLTIGSRGAPCLLPSGLPQPSLAALPCGFFETPGGFEGSAVGQDPRLDTPP